MWISAWDHDHGQTRDEWIDYSFNGQRHAIAQVRIHGGGYSTQGVRIVQVREVPSLKVLHTFVTKKSGRYETHPVEGVTDVDKIRLHFVDNHGSSIHMRVQHVEFFGWF